MTSGICQKIGVVSWSIPPSTSGSAVVVGNLARQFQREEMVLMGERPTVQAPLDWRLEWPATEFLARSLPAGMRGARWYQLTQLPWVMGRLLRAVKKHKCTDLLAVYPNDLFLLAAVTVARHSRCRLVPYFHNTYLENSTGMRRQIAVRLQAQAFRQAYHVFAMSEGMVEHYRAAYPELRCSSLVHTFPELPRVTETAVPEGPLRFAFAGNINASCVDAATRMRAALDRTPHGSITYLGGLPEALLRRQGVLPRGAVCRHVPAEELLGVLAEADVVLLPHGFQGSLSEVEYRTIFPTKTIDYLICGRPILAHSPPEAFLTRFLRKHDCALIVDTPEVKEVEAAIDLLRRDASLRRRLVRNARQAAMMFHGPVVALHLREVLGMSRGSGSGVYRESGQGKSMGEVS